MAQTRRSRRVVKSTNVDDNQSGHDEPASRASSVVSQQFEEAELKSLDTDEDEVDESALKDKKPVKVTKLDESATFQVVSSDDEAESEGHKRQLSLNDLSSASLEASVDGDNENADVQVNLVYPSTKSDSADDANENDIEETPKRVIAEKGPYLEEEVDEDDRDVQIFHDSIEEKQASISQKKISGREDEEEGSSSHTLDGQVSPSSKMKINSSHSSLSEDGLANNKHNSKSLGLEGKPVHLPADEDEQETYYGSREGEQNSVSAGNNSESERSANGHEKYQTDVRYPSPSTNYAKVRLNRIQREFIIEEPSSPPLSRSSSYFDSIPHSIVVEEVSEEVIIEIADDDDDDEDEVTKRKYQDQETSEAEANQTITPSTSAKNLRKSIEPIQEPITLSSENILPETLDADLIGQNVIEESINENPILANDALANDISELANERDRAATAAAAVDYDSDAGEHEEESEKEEFINSNSNSPHFGGIGGLSGLGRSIHSPKSKVVHDTIKVIRAEPQLGHQFREVAGQFKPNNSLLEVKETDTFNPMQEFTARSTNKSKEDKRNAADLARKMLMEEVIAPSLMEDELIVIDKPVKEQKVAAPTSLKIAEKEPIEIIGSSEAKPSVSSAANFLFAPQETITPQGVAPEIALQTDPKKSNEVILPSTTSPTDTRSSVSRSQIAENRIRGKPLESQEGKFANISKLPSLNGKDNESLDFSDMADTFRTRQLKKLDGISGVIGESDEDRARRLQANLNSKLNSPKNPKQTTIETVQDVDAGFAQIADFEKSILDDDRKKRGVRHKDEVPNRPDLAFNPPQAPVQKPKSSTSSSIPFQKGVGSMHHLSNLVDIPSLQQPLPTSNRKYQSSLHYKDSNFRRPEGWETEAEPLPSGPKLQRELMNWELADTIALNKEVHVSSSTKPSRKWPCFRKDNPATSSLDTEKNIRNNGRLHTGTGSVKQHNVNSGQEGTKIYNNNNSQRDYYQQENYNPKSNDEVPNRSGSRASWRFNHGNNFDESNHGNYQNYKQQEGAGNNNNYGKKTSNRAHQEQQNTRDDSEFYLDESLEAGLYGNNSYHSNSNRKRNYSPNHQSYPQKRYNNNGGRSYDRY